MYICCCCILLLFVLPLMVNKVVYICMTAQTENSYISGKLQSNFCFFHGHNHHVCPDVLKKHAIITAILYLNEWNIFYNKRFTIFPVSRGISISGLGGHIAISGCTRRCRNHPRDTFFEVAVVENLDFVTLITVIIILDPFCHISQHERKISPV